MTKSLIDNLEAISPMVRLAAKAFSRSKSPLATVDDLFQEGMIAAWKRLENNEFDPRKSSLWRFVFPCVKGAMINYLKQYGIYGRKHLRAEKRGQALPVQVRLTDTIGNSEDLAVSSDPLTDDFAAIVKSLYPHITDKELQLLVMRFEQGLSGNEIAELTGKTVTNISRIQCNSLRRIAAIQNQVQTN